MSKNDLNESENEQNKNNNNSIPNNEESNEDNENEDEEEKNEPNDKEVKIEVVDKLINTDKLNDSELERLVKENQDLKLLLNDDKGNNNTNPEPVKKGCKSSIVSSVYVSILSMIVMLTLIIKKQIFIRRKR